MFEPTFDSVIATQCIHPRLTALGIKAVFFDHDDTLVKTFKAKSDQHIYVARTHYGRDITPEFIASHWGKPLPELVKILYGIDSSDDALAHNKACQHLFPKTPIAGVPRVLSALKSKGLKVGVVTATVRFSFNNDLKIAQWPVGLFDYVQTAENTSFHKPDPKVFIPAISWLSSMGITKEQVMYIGDGVHDYSAAQGAGFHFIGVQTGLTPVSVFNERGAFTLPSVEALTQ